MKYLSFLIIFLFISCSSKTIEHTAKVTVENKSGVKIEKISINLSNQVTKKPLVTKQNNTYTYEFDDYSNNHFVLRVKFEDSLELEKKFGYITHNISFDEKLIIHTTDMNTWIHESSYTD